ncbi:heterokaryon incompatibility protein-domain-containing protein [Paraphoma chrysanthemicola]|uniref:Heterokaryon incompatibility protein-domain-containing protein n=1 Tax=Paraphoma chrysanthemicola TaxID=798071 RepID=A0A8K0W204_9PLEO|nr:heterokaryon incompatibility protein-domain-containing protein [Paraphoma chrysanthemicola]
MAMLKPPLYPVPDTEGLCESIKAAKRDPMTGVMKPRFELSELTCCEFCEIIRQAVPPGWKSTEVTMYGNMIEISNDAGPDLVNKFRLDDTGSNRTDPERMILCPLKDVPCPWGLSPSRLGGSLIRTPPDINWCDVSARAANVVERCLAMHSCGDATIPELPTRIIDVGEAPNLCDVRLIEAVGQKASYVCLSHCWGGERPLKTTKDNLHNHLQSIPWLSMPKMYQDSVLVARKLRIRYLWIDSLCIVQDDFNDWVRESAVMGNTYERALLTISAISAPDCHSSLLESSPSKSFVLEGVNSAGKSYAYAVSPLSYNSLARHPQNSDFDRKKWPLLDRAWVFQERILSSRVLHFSQLELIFECKHETVCECGFVDIDNMRDKKLYHKSVQEASSTRLTRLWYYFIEWYSDLSCSAVTDRLPALSGFAQRFAKLQPGSRYLAGLWDKSLNLDLLWWVANEHDYKDQPQQYVAPSWSWAATRKRVLFASSDYWYSQADLVKEFSILKQYFQIESADCYPATSDLTGQVSGGQLTVSGRVFDAVLQGEARWLNIQGSDVDIATRQRWDQTDKPVLRPDSGDWCTEGLANSRLVCLPLARLRRRRMEDKQEDVELTMVLTCPRNDKSSYYRRIGMILQRSYTTYVDGCALEAIQKYWHENPSPFEVGGKKETLTII